MELNNYNLFVPIVDVMDLLVINLYFAFSNIFNIYDYKILFK